MRSSKPGVDPGFYFYEITVGFSVLFIQRNLNIVTERDIQKLCVEYFRKVYQGQGEIICVPNEVTHYSSNKWQAVGMRKGCSDLIVVLKGKIVFVELKTPQNKQSYEQVGFQRSVENLGYEYYVVRSLDEFIYVIKHAYTANNANYANWEKNLDKVLPKTKKQVKVEKKVIKQRVELALPTWDELD